MARTRYVVVRVADSDDDAEAFGIFSTEWRANFFREKLEAVTCYQYLVIEVVGVEACWKMIREEEAALDG